MQISTYDLPCDEPKNSVGSVRQRALAHPFAHPVTHVVRANVISMGHGHFVYAPILQLDGSIVLVGSAPASALALVEPRLIELRAAADEEGIKYSRAAEATLLEFLQEAGATARPALFVLDDGALRAKWTNLSGEQISLQFARDGYVHLVYFVQRGGGVVSRGFGRDTLDGALAQIRSLGLLPLLKA